MRQSNRQAAKKGAGKQKKRQETPAQRRRRRLKVKLAKELGLWQKVVRNGWGGLTAAESGRIGGLLAGRRRRREKV